MSTATTRSSPCWTATRSRSLFWAARWVLTRDAWARTSSARAACPHEVYDALQIGQTHIEDACREVVG